MRRGLAMAWRWRVPYWVRVAPGPVGGLVYTLLPALFFVPLESLSVFPDRPRGILVVMWCMSIALGIVVAAGRGLRDEEAIWLVQKGVSPGDAALEDWILDAGLLVIACAYWSAVGALALTSYAPVFKSMLGLFLFTLATSLLARTLAGCLSAWGVRRPSDLTGVAAFLSLAVPLLTVSQSPAVQKAVDWLFPPFLKGVALGTGFHAGEVGAAAEAALQVLLYISVLLAATYWRASRWRPRG